MSYTPPTKAEFRALLDGAGFTQAKVASIVDVSVRQAQRWAAGDPMPYAALAALLAVGFKRRPGPPENWRGRVADLLPPADQSSA